MKSGKFFLTVYKSTFKKKVQFSSNPYLGKVVTSVWIKCSNRSIHKPTSVYY